MRRKSKRKSRRRRKPVTPQPPDSQPEQKVSRFQTPIGDFVRYEDKPPYAEYYLFRSDHDQILMQYVKRAYAEEEIDWEEAVRRLDRFGLLMLAPDERGFNAHLFLDWTLVEETEVETLIQGTLDLLNQILPHSESGSLAVHWMGDIGYYSTRQGAQLC